MRRFWSWYDGKEHTQTITTGNARGESNVIAVLRNEIGIINQNHLHQCCQCKRDDIQSCLEDMLGQNGEVEVVEDGVMHERLGRDTLCWVVDEHFLKQEDSLIALTWCH